MSLDTANLVVFLLGLVVQMSIGFVCGLSIYWLQHRDAALADWREFIKRLNAPTNSTGPDSPVKGCQCVECRRHRWEQQGRPPL